MLQVGIAGVAAGVLVASQAGLIGQPARYGWNWDASIPGTDSGGAISDVNRGELFDAN